jgi:hypothetical protein
VWWCGGGARLRDQHGEGASNANQEGEKDRVRLQAAAAVNEMVLYDDDIHAPHSTAPHSRKQDVVRRSQRDGGTPQKPRDSLDMAGIARMAYIL